MLSFLLSPQSLVPRIASIISSLSLSPIGALPAAFFSLCCRCCRNSHFTGFINYERMRLALWYSSQIKQCRKHQWCSLWAHCVKPHGRDARASFISNCSPNPFLCLQLWYLMGASREQGICWAKQLPGEKPASNSWALFLPQDSVGGVCRVTRTSLFKAAVALPKLQFAGSPA